MKNRHIQQRGIVTLLSLVLMATISAIAVGASVILIQELQLSETFDQSLLAGYAAESGMENGLYTIKMNRNSETIGDTVTAINANASVLLADVTSARWTTTAKENLDFLTIPSLAPDQSVVLDFVDPDNSTRGYRFGENPQARNVYLTWEDACNGFSWLEATMIDLSPLFTAGSVTPAVSKSTQACNCGTNCEGFTGSTDRAICTPWAIHTFGSDNLEFFGQPTRFVFRPLLPLGSNAADCRVENLKVEIHDEFWEPGRDDEPSYRETHVKPIPAQVTITSVGTFGRTQQALSAVVPWHAPASGLLSFVLFSEEDLIK